MPKVITYTLGLAYYLHFSNEGQQNPMHYICHPARTDITRQGLPTGQKLSMETYLKTHF